MKLSICEVFLKIYILVVVVVVEVVAVVMGLEWSQFLSFCSCTYYDKKYCCWKFTIRDLKTFPFVMSIQY